MLNKRVHVRALIRRIGDDHVGRTVMSACERVLSGRLVAVAGAAQAVRFQCANQ
jgi:hypothetical protein